MRRSTGQATIELLVLCGLVAALLLLLGGALATGAAAATARALQRALRPPHPVHDDTWALGSPTRRWRGTHPLTLPSPLGTLGDRGRGVAEPVEASGTRRHVQAPPRLSRG